MTPEKIKERIRKAVQKVTPDISEQIIQDAEKNIYKAKKEKRNVFSWKPALVLATSCLLFVTIFVYWPAKNVVAEKKEEPLPDIAMKGVVLSDNKQAIILNVDGKIEILTSQKPLQSGIELVKVSKEEAVLAYKGREIVLKF